MSAADIEWVNTPEGVTEFWEDALIDFDPPITNDYEWDDLDKAFEDAIEFQSDDIDLDSDFEMEYDDAEDDWQDDLMDDYQDDFDSDYYL